MRDDWEAFKLDQLGFVGRGKSRHRPRNDPSLYGGPYPFIQTADIMASEFRIRRYTKTYNEAGLAQSKLWEEETLCMTIAGANTGETAILDFPACFPDSIVGFIPDKKKCDIRFVKYTLGTMIEAFRRVSRGATQDNLSLDKLLSFPIRTPPLPEQRRIAAILSAYDNLIENNTRRIAILEEMARRLYEEWFVHFRFLGNEGVDFVETELGSVPTGWSVVPMQEICSRITDGAHKSPPSTEAGMPMASVKDMHDWGFSIEKCRRISVADYEELERNNCRPMVGDVVIAKDGSYLKHTFAIEKELDLVVLSSVAILRPNERVLPDFLALALRDPGVVARMKGVVSGVAIPRIVLKDFRAFKLILPPKELQCEWQERAGPMLTLCRRLVDKNANLRAQRDLLLPKLVSGEIDVSEAQKAMEAAE